MKAVHRWPREGSGAWVKFGQKKNPCHQVANGGGSRGKSTEQKPRDCIWRCDIVSFESHCSCVLVKNQTSNFNRKEFNRGDWLKEYHQRPEKVKGDTGAPERNFREAAPAPKASGTKQRRIRLLELVSLK